MTPEDAPGRPQTTLAWMGEGTQYLLDRVDGIGDAEFTQPSLLPGWSRGHVVSHLARNADALCNLLHWAITGEPTPMYADASQRTAEIEAGARRGGAVIRSDLLASCRRLDALVDEVPDDHWGYEVRTARGRAVPATEIPWLRVREVWIHAVDLGTGGTLADLPKALVDSLLDELTVELAEHEGCPQVALTATDREVGWQLGRAAQTPSVVAGPAHVLLGWLTGRCGLDALDVRTDGSPPPVLPPWI